MITSNKKEINVESQVSMVVNVVNQNNTTTTQGTTKELPEKITFYESLTVAELAKKLHREPSEIIKKLFMLGVMATINQELDKDAIELICADYGVEVEEEIRIDKTDLERYFEEQSDSRRRS